MVRIFFRLSGGREIVCLPTGERLRAFMVKYIVKRLLWMIPILLGVVVIVFTIQHFTPGDPVAAILGTSCTPEQYEMKRAELGLDEPFIVQLWEYIKGIVTRFDLGQSYTSKRDVRTMIFERFKPTFIIGILSTLLSTVVAIPLGIIAATKQGKALDTVTIGATVVLAAIPSYWFAMMMLLLFCLKIPIFPAAGIATPLGYVLPIACSILNHLVVTLRMTRTSMLEVIRSDFIRTARAKGVPEGQVLRRHALNNALIPVLTTLGMHLGGSLGGSILIETIFTIPGLGILMKEAIAGFDYPLVQGCVLFLSFIMSMMNLLTDLAYGIVDPRVHDQYTGGKRKKNAAKKEALVNG